MSDKAKVHTTKLSVNVNKIATLRNARGGSIPNVLLAAERIENFGAQGITVHPRPDARHITYEDVRGLKNLVQTEFNIEGYPNDRFINLVLEVVPEQVTLVPDPPDVLTSNAGWDAIENADLLREVISRFKSAGIRTSIFMDTDEDQIHAAAETGTDRIELYTEAYAVGHKSIGAEAAIAPSTTSGYFIRNQPASIPPYEPPNATAGARSWCFVRNHSMTDAQSAFACAVVQNAKHCCVPAPQIAGCDKGS